MDDEFAPSGDLQRDTAVRTTADADRYDATIRDGYGAIKRVPNGGLLLALATRAMLTTLERPAVLTVTGHFLRPTTPGAASVSVDVLRAGRISTARTTVTQDERLTLHAVGSFANRGELGTLRRLDLTPPELPPPDHCLDVPTIVANGFDLPPVFRRLDHRVPPPLAHALRTGDSTHAAISGWFRPLRGAVDEATMPFLMDAMFPPVFVLGGPIAFTPTLEFTVQVRRPPPVGWMAYRFATRAISGGIMEEDGQLWTADGELIALSRQTALPAVG